MQIDGLAFDELDRRAAHGADDVVFAQAFRHRRAGDEAERRLPADRDCNRHFLVALLLPRSDVMADMLGAPHQDRNVVLVADHAAIDADIHHIGVGILGDDAAVSHDVAAAVEPVPLRHRQLVEIDVIAFDDVLLDRTGRDDFRRNGVGQHGAAELDQFARMRVRRHAEHHGDAARARQAAGEDLAAARIGAVVLDVVEQHRGSGAGALRQPRDGAELDIPIDLGFDALQFARGIERFDPTADVAERDRLSFRAHDLWAFLG